MKSATFESQSDDGLYGVAARAGQALAGPDNDPVGLVEITRADGDLEITIEAVFAYRGVRRSIDSLDVRVRRFGDDARVQDALLNEALEGFGGERYTNLCVADPDAEEGADFDVTVCFPSRVPFWATNLTLAPDAISKSDVELYSELLSHLGVSCRCNDGTVTSRDRQLRGPMTHGQQSSAYRCAADKGLNVALYSATLPASRSMRIREGVAERDGKQSRCVDCFLSRGLGGDESCSTADAWEMEDFMKRHFGIEFASQTWNAENTVAEGPPEERGEPPARRPKGGIKFSFWVKG